MKSKNNLSKPVTLKDLGEFTEKVIFPAVENIVEDKIAPLRDGVDSLKEEVKSGFEEMRAGFSSVNKSIRVLAGEIIELKENEKEQKHEERLRVVERKIGVR